MPRKPPPDRFYREEVTYPDDLRRFNSTRETRNRHIYESWRNLKRDSGESVRFLIGSVTWEEDNRDG